MWRRLKRQNATGAKGKWMSREGHEGCKLISSPPSRSSRDSRPEQGDYLRKLVPIISHARTGSHRPKRRVERRLGGAHCHMRVAPKHIQGIGIFARAMRNPFVDV